MVEIQDQIHRFKSNSKMDAGKNFSSELNKIQKMESSLRFETIKS